MAKVQRAKALRERRPIVIGDLRTFYQNQPINNVRQRLRESRQFLHCLKMMVDEGVFEEAHIIALRTITEKRIEILEEILRVSEETIKQLREGS